MNAPINIDRFPVIAPGNSKFVDLGHPGFNPSLIRFNGKLIFAWRRGWSPGRLHIGELDDEHRIRFSKRLLLNGVNNDRSDGFEDPRLFIFANDLWMSYTIVHRSHPRMAIARLSLDYQIIEHRSFLGHDGRMEKNWQFFEHEDVLHGIYMIRPHLVGVIGEKDFEIVHRTSGLLYWRWGEPRGGTPPVRIGDEYFSFFHSSRSWDYVAGFYAFEAQPPFRITRWPSKPCMIAKRDPWRTEGPRVVFPGGVLYADGKWLVSYGWHDTHSCLIEFDHAELLGSLDFVKGAIAGNFGRIMASFTASGSFMPKKTVAQPPKVRLPRRFRPSKRTAEDVPNGYSIPGEEK